MMDSCESCVCNGCGASFETDDELESGEDEDGFFLGCPECKTDANLMDVKPGEVPASPL